MKVLGVCGAQGALLYPFKPYVVGNVDNRSLLHTKEEEQWKANFGDIPFDKTPYQVFAKYQPGEIDVIVGSPSCGHSSKFAKSRMKELKNPREDASLNLFLDAIEKLQPKIFLMENLPKLIETVPLKEWRLRFPNYRFIAHAITVDILGNSQKNRRRLILIGTNRDVKIRRAPLKKVFPVNHPMTCIQILEKSRPHLNFIEELSDTLPMIDYKDTSKRNMTVEEIKNTWMGKYRKMWLWPMTTYKMKFLPGVYRNRKNEFPHTLRPCPRQFNHLGWPMGLEEFRITMGFPEDFVVYMNHAKHKYWMNKGRLTLCKGAVYEIGKWFYIQLKEAMPEWFDLEVEKKENDKKEKGFPLNNPLSKKKKLIKKKKVLLKLKPRS